MVISNNLLMQWGNYKKTTAAGSTLQTTVNLSISYITNYKPTITNFRLSGWAYYSLYSVCYMTDSMSTMTVQCIGANTAQFIDGFSWTTLGF